MPVILKPADYAVWLDRQLQNPENLLSLLKPFDTEPMDAYPVNPHVNNPRNDDPGVLEPIDLTEMLA